MAPPTGARWIDWDLGSYSGATRCAPIVSRYLVKWKRTFHEKQQLPTSDARGDRGHFAAVPHWLWGNGCLQVLAPFLPLFLTPPPARHTLIGQQLRRRFGRLAMNDIVTSLRYGNVFHLSVCRSFSWLQTDHYCLIITRHGVTMA